MEERGGVRDEWKVKEVTKKRMRGERRPRKQKGWAAKEHAHGAIIKSGESERRMPMQARCGSSSSCGWRSQIKPSAILTAASLSCKKLTPVSSPSPAIAQSSGRSAAAAATRCESDLGNAAVSSVGITMESMGALWFVAAKLNDFASLLMMKDPGDTGSSNRSESACGSRG